MGRSKKRQSNLRHVGLCDHVQPPVHAKSPSVPQPFIPAVLVRASNRTSAQRMTRHGFPTAIELAETSRVTTLPAPITQLSPIVTPGQIIVPPPIHTLLPMVT